jgi:methionyl-tRNA formyltransferase
LKVRLLEARLVQTHPGARPGDVLAVDGDGFTVAAGDGAIRLGKIRTESGKQDAGAFAAAAGLKPGESFMAG